jgi:Zn-dependent protease
MLPISLMLIFSIQINLLLAVFNLIPIPPLDGGRILVGVLPHKYSNILSSIEPFGMLILILIIFIDPMGIANHIIFRTVNILAQLLFGG